MNKLRCDICGGTLVMQAGGTVAVCDSCGMQYSTDRMREKVQEIRGTVSVEGVVKTQSADFDVQGGVLVAYHGAATEVVVPEDVKIIGKSAFSKMNGIAKVVLQKGVVEIDDNAFDGCERLSEVVLSDGLVKIGFRAFSGCKSLQVINLPNSLSEIMSQAFCGCIRLKTVALPNNLTTLSNYVFMEAGIQAITIPNNVVKIGEYAFGNCNKLTRISLSKSLRKIGEGAFAFCINLNEIEFPQGIEKINMGAFAFCYKLHSINLPDSLVELGRGVFYGCANLEAVAVSDNLINRLWLFEMKAPPSYGCYYDVQKWDAFSSYPCPDGDDLGCDYITLPFEKPMEVCNGVSLWYRNLSTAINASEKEKYDLKTQKDQQEQKQKYYMEHNLCRHCGGNFRGIFNKVCSKCGRPKDY